MVLALHIELCHSCIVLRSTCYTTHNERNLHCCLHPRLVLQHDVFSVLSPQVIARWWHQQQPLIAQFVRDHGAFLIDLITPFTPRASRRAGYCCASHDLLRSFDRVDIELPGGEGSWSSRWQSRCQGVRRGTAVLPGGISSVYTAIGGAGVAAVVAVVAAAGVTGILRCCCLAYRGSTMHPLRLGLICALYP